MPICIKHSDEIDKYIFLVASRLWDHTCRIMANIWRLKIKYLLNRDIVLICFKIDQAFLITDLPLGAPSTGPTSPYSSFLLTPPPGLSTSMAVLSSAQVTQFEKHCSG